MALINIFAFSKSYFDILNVEKEEVFPEPVKGEGDEIKWAKIENRWTKVEKKHNSEKPKAETYLFCCGEELQECDDFCNYGDYGFDKDSLNENFFQESFWG